MSVLIKKRCMSYCKSRYIAISQHRVIKSSSPLPTLFNNYKYHTADSRSRFFVFLNFVFYDVFGVCVPKSETVLPPSNGRGVGAMCRRSCSATFLPADGLLEGEVVQTPCDLRTCILYFLLVALRGHLVGDNEAKLVRVIDLEGFPNPLALRLPRRVSPGE